MRKVMVSKSAVAMINSTATDKKLFPPGFRYRMGSIIYTVKADITQDITNPIREVSLSDGATEIVPVETLLKDIREIQNSRNKTAGEIMEPDLRFAPQSAVAPIKKKAKKKVKKVKKKKAKKKVKKVKKKKAKKNGR